MRQASTREAMVSGPFAEARSASLLGEPGDPLPLRDGSLRLSVAPWEIVTLLLARTADGA